MMPPNIGPTHAVDPRSYRHSVPRNVGLVVSSIVSPSWAYGASAVGFTPGSGVRAGRKAYCGFAARPIAPVISNTGFGGPGITPPPLAGVPLDPPCAVAALLINACTCACSVAIWEFNSARFGGVVMLEASLSYTSEIAAFTSSVALGTASLVNGCCGVFATV